jgi:hypothetical protein
LRNAAYVAALRLQTRRPLLQRAAVLRRRHDAVTARRFRKRRHVVSSPHFELEALRVMSARNARYFGQRHDVSDAVQSPEF